MSAEKTVEEYYELIASYLSGNADDAAVQKLEAWVLEKPEHKAIFKKYKQAWILTGMEKDQLPIDIQKEWAKSKEVLFIKGDQKAPTKIVSLGNKPSAQPAVQKKGFAGWWRIAAAIALLAGASLWLLNRGTSGTMQVLAESEMVEQGLPDGSQVALNQFATLTFDNTGETNKRQVELKGDAFFEVARDTEHPFIINTQEVQIEVLGTSFYVDSRENLSEIRVIVASGSVAVRSGNQEVILKANESGIYDKVNNKLEKIAEVDPNYLAWKTGVLNFENTSLAEVAFALNRQYHANISLASPDLAHCKLTATYTNKSLDAVLTIIEQTMGLTVKKNRDNILISGAGC